MKLEHVGVWCPHCKSLVYVYLVSESDFIYTCPECESRMMIKIEYVATKA